MSHSRIARCEHRIERHNRLLRRDLERYDSLLRRWQEAHRT